MSMATDNLLILSSDEKLKDDSLNISSEELLEKNTDEEFSDDFESNNLSSSTSSSETITKNKKDNIKSDIDSDCVIKDNVNLESLDCNKNEIFENDNSEINLCDFPSEKHIIVNGNHNVNIDGDIIKIITEEKDINAPTTVKKSDSNDNLELHTDEKCYDSNTDFVGLEIALTESNIKEPFLEELCTKMGSVVKPPVELDIKLQNLSKDDSTDIDVSYTSDSLSPESDQDIGSSFVESSYQQLHQEIENKFRNEIERLKWRLSELEKEALHEACQNQISTMEKAVEQIKMELDLSRQEHALDTRTFSNERQELESKIENLKKEYQVANKDREAAVMRYACGEMELMNHKKERETAEKKLKDCVKEKEVLISKLKTLTTDKSRVCQMLDNKCSDLTVVQKEIDNLKEELNSRDIKIKWMQNKLRSETDARKDLEAKVELLNGKVQESLQEAEKAKHDAQESIKQFQESEENKAYTLGQQLKEEQVKYMLLQHEHDENESVRKQLQSELDTCRIRLQASAEENNSMTLKVQILEKERLEYEQNLSQLKQKTDAQSKTIADLHGSVKDAEALRIQLQCEQDRVANSQSEMERLRLSNSELVQDMESCRKRESDMLEFTQKLTAKNVRLQSEFTAVEAKVQQLECEEAPLHKKIAELESKVANLLKDLEKEKSQRIEESKVLARHLAEKTARVKTLESQVEELTNEIQLVKRKDAATIKELNRELTQLRRRGEHNESGSGSDSLCHGSRTSSCTSLNEHSASSVPPPPSVTTSHPSLQMEPNRQALIERIVKLQRENAKAVEKIDFLEEHARTLVEELQKKSKVLQSYILREEAGALSSSSMDLNKSVLKGWSRLKTRAELTKHGGIMASVYGSKAVDDNMTLELSLEINRKLQAVLEDTLLKNITLKENIDTLGDEIARLTQRRHHS